MADDFDDSKDTLIAHVGDVPAEGKSAAITVDVKSYDGGAPKIRLNRTGEKRDGTPFTGKLGSLSTREARALADLLPKAADLLEAADVPPKKTGKTGAKGKTSAKGK